MKNLLTLILLFPALCYCQNQDFKFIKIDSVSGSKSDLYSKSKIWIADNFRSTKDVLQMDDKDAGHIVVRTLFKTVAKGGFGNSIGYDYVNFKISIDIKDGKYRIVIDEFEHETGPNTRAPGGGSLTKDKPESGYYAGFSKKRWIEIKQEAVDLSDKLMIDFAAAMNKKLPPNEF